MDGARTATERSVGPVATALNGVIENCWIASKRIRANVNVSEDGFDGFPDPLSCTPDAARQIIRQARTFRDIVEPLRRLHPSDIRIAKIAQCPFEQSGK